MAQDRMKVLFPSAGAPASTQCNSKGLEVGGVTWTNGINMLKISERDPGGGAVGSIPLAETNESPDPETGTIRPLSDGLGCGGRIAPLVGATAGSTTLTKKLP
jgi:hypothetical protein